MDRTKKLAGVRHAFVKREEVIHAIVLAVLLALGVELLASFIVSHFFDASHGLLWIGSGLCLLALLYLMFVVLRARCTSYVFEGIVTLAGDEVMKIPGYVMTEELHRIMEAAFLENSALASSWKREHIVKRATSSVRNVKSAIENREESSPVYFAIVKVQGERPEPSVLLSEALEFLVLEQLSLHLSSYFEGLDGSDKQIIEYRREDVPTLLLNNRILSLLTTPLADRALFADAGPFEDSGGTVHAVRGSDGALYSRFDLVLPKNTEVRRPALGTLELENDYIALSIRMDAGSYSANLPADFERLFLRVKRHTIAAFKVDIAITTTVKKWTLVRGNGRKYDGWVDSFAERMAEVTDFSRFLDEIGWHSSIVALRMQESLRTRARKEE